MQALEIKDSGIRSQRRQLTIMFCDLVESTRLSSKLDPEEYADILHAYHETVFHVIKNYNGEVSQYLGDGLRILFGYPSAMENDPENSIRAALGIVEEIAKLDFKPLKKNNLNKIQVRIGIATGIVVVGNILGNGTTEEMAVYGETPNIAARLQSLASPGTILVSDLTKKLINNIFCVEDLGVLKTKGIINGLKTWEIKGENTSGDRFQQTQLSRMSKIIGRENELIQLQTFASDAAYGKGQVVLIKGEAGIGKSRIVHEFIHNRCVPGFKSLGFQCSPYHMDSSLYPLLSKVRKDNIDISEELILQLFHVRLKDKDDINMQIIPYLQSQLSYDDYGSDHQDQITDMEKLKRDAFNSLSSLISYASQTQPLQIIIEDIHWLDPTSIELLSELISHIKKERVLIILTTRAETQTSLLANEFINEIRVAPLNKFEAGEFAKQLIESAEIDNINVEQVLKRADGKPLYIEEIIKASQFYSDSSIPASLKDSLTSRLDKLSAARELAQVSAVIGRDFTLELLEHVMDIDSELIISHLSDLINNDIIYLSDKNNITYSFRHALIREAAYDSLLIRKRKAIHNKLAITLSNLYPDIYKHEPELIAYHFTEAGDARPAVEMWINAARRALSISTYSEMHAYISKGMKTIVDIKDKSHRDQFELDLQILKGTAHRATDGFSSILVEQSFTKSLELSLRMNDRAKKIDALRGLFACFYVRAEHSHAIEQANRVLVYSENIPWINMLGYWMRGCTLFWQGKYEDSEKELLQSISLYEPKSNEKHMLANQIDPGLNANIHLIWLLWITGRTDQSIHLSERMIQHARRLNQPFALAMALWWTCVTKICCGEYNDARKIYTELDNVTRENQISYLALTGKILNGQLLLEEGDITTAKITINNAWDKLESQGALLGKPWMTLILAMLELKRQNLKEAELLIEKSFALCKNHGENHWLSEIYRIQGNLFALKNENAEKVYSCYVSAMKLARQQGALSLELRATNDYVLFSLDHNKKRSALEDLKFIYDKFSEGFATQDLQISKHLLMNY